MGYLFLLIALLAGSTKGYCGKKTSAFVTKTSDAIFINFIRMFLCILIGLIMVFTEGNMSYMGINSRSLPIYLMSGVSTSAFVVFWLIVVKKSAYMMIDVFLMLGVLVPITLSSVIFHENVKITQWVGILFLFVAVYIMCSYNSKLKGKMTMTSFLLLVLCGFSNGVTDFSQKLFVKTFANIPVSVFNFYTYVFSALVLALCYVIFVFCDKSGENIKFVPQVPNKMYIYVIIMAFCLFANSYFKTIAASYMTSAMLYPLNQGAALILSSFMSAFLFGEKLSVRAIIGIALSFISLIVINVL